MSTTFQAHNAHCLEVLRAMSHGSVDCVVTDPPYRLAAGGATKALGGHIFDNNDGQLFAHNNIGPREYLPLLHQVMKADSDLYLMTNYSNLTDFLTAAMESGFRLHNILVWHKGTAMPNRWYMKNVEFTLYLFKGAARTINNPSSMAMQTIPNPRNKVHPCQKPVALMKHYITNSTQRGDVVLDPFMGGGSTGVAAIQAGRRFIGIEIDLEYYGHAVERIHRADGTGSDSGHAQLSMMGGAA